MSESVRIAIILVLVLVLAGWAGTSDFEEAKRDERVYCEQVVAGEIEPYRDVTCGEGE